MKNDVQKTIAVLERDGRFHMERQFFQHGTTTVFDHSVKVAYTSVRLAKFLHLKTDRHALIRGALLHDYFLYDWHDKHHGHSPHGFSHPKTALRNAQEDFALNPIEENIIERHMFPLTLYPPTCREAWIVCLADKYCALLETIWDRMHPRSGAVQG